MLGGWNHLALMLNDSKCQYDRCYWSMSFSLFTSFFFSLELLEQVHAIGKASKNIFSATQNFSSFHGDGDPSSHSPVISFKAHLIRLIGNLCHSNTNNQNKVCIVFQRIKKTSECICGSVNLPTTGKCADKSFDISTETTYSSSGHVVATWIRLRGRRFDFLL